MHSRWKNDYFLVIWSCSLHGLLGGPALVTLWGGGLQFQVTLSSTHTHADRRVLKQTYASANLSHIDIYTPAYFYIYLSLLKTIFNNFGKLQYTIYCNIQFKIHHTSINISISRPVLIFIVLLYCMFWLD